jgi:hypothetical protein
VFVPSNFKSLMLRSCTFIDAHGSTFEVDVEDLGKSKADLLGEDLV